ncbi:MAG TPA: hypothetical protein VLV78_21220 [Thermoanaerobaculia bacterium]|nr:hypothetical protein [Thermoanaerobaculia bacterium]
MVKIGYAESELRKRVRQAGACWNAQRKVWMMRGAAVRRLGLEGRVVGRVEVE